MLKRIILTGVVVILSGAVMAGCQERELSRVSYLKVKQEMYPKQPSYGMFSKAGKLRFMPLIIGTMRSLMRAEVRRACRNSRVRYRDFNRAHERYSIYRYPYTCQMEYYLTMAWEHGCGIDGPMVYIDELDYDLGITRMKLFVSPESDSVSGRLWINGTSSFDSCTSIQSWEPASAIFYAADSFPRGRIIISEFWGEYIAEDMSDIPIKAWPQFSHQTLDSLLKDTAGTLIIQLAADGSGTIGHYSIGSRRQMLYTAQRIRRREPSYKALVIAVEDSVLTDDVAWVVRKAGEGVEMVPAGIFIVPCSLLNPGIIPKNTFPSRDVPQLPPTGPIGDYFMDNFMWLLIKHYFTPLGWTFC